MNLYHVSAHIPKSKSVPFKDLWSIQGLQVEEKVRIWRAIVSVSTSWATIDFSPFSLIQNLGHNSTMGSPSIIKSPIFNVVFLLVSMQMSKRINWDDPNTLLYARIGYYGAQVLVIGMAYMLIGLIKKRNGMYHVLFNEENDTSGY